MYTDDDDTELESLQPIVYAWGKDTTDTTDETELTSLDPLGERIWAIVSGLLKTKTEITIQDVLEVSDITESPIRSRLNLLVKLKYIGSANGTGRRPTYYFLPNPNDLQKQEATPEQIIQALQKSLEKVSRKEKKLQEQLSALKEQLSAALIDKAAIEQTIKIQQRHGDTYD